MLYHTVLAALLTLVAVNAVPTSNILRFEAGQTKTIHNVAAGRYSLKSPNYPSNYDNGLDGWLLVLPPAGGSVSLSCSDFVFEPSSTCAYDYLSVNGDRYCGTSAPPSTAHNRLSLSMYSDNSITAKGFSCTVTVSDSGSSIVSGGGGPGSASVSSSCSCGVPNRSSRIVNGQETEVYEYPWQAGLVSPGGTRTWCGGTVINNQFVLTAAHCTTRGPSGIQVLLRENQISNSDGEQRFSVAQVIDHPGYSSSTFDNDYSLLKLSTSITFPSDNTLAPACLPVNINDDFSGAPAIVSGWGTTSSGGSQATKLREVLVPVVTTSACRSSYGSSKITSQMICAGYPQGGRDSCQGDSGGPLISTEGDRYSVVGVVSWGYGCAAPRHFGVYARVTAVLSWIQSNTAAATYCSRT